MPLTSNTCFGSWDYQIAEEHIFSDKISNRLWQQAIIENHAKTSTIPPSSCKNFISYQMQNSYYRTDRFYPRTVAGFLVERCDDWKKNCLIASTFSGVLAVLTSPEHGASMTKSVPIDISTLLKIERRLLTPSCWPRLRFTRNFRCE